jgi:hypothetical protein
MSYQICGRKAGSSILRRVKKFLSPAQCPDCFWSSASLLYNGYRKIFPQENGGRGCEVDHSPPSSAKIKNVGAVHPLLHTSSWRGAYLIKRMDFTLPLSHTLPRRQMINTSNASESNGSHIFNLDTTRRRVFRFTL